MVWLNLKISPDGVWNPTASSFRPGRRGTRSYGGIFDLEALRDELDRRQKTTAEQGFWDDQARAQGVLKQISALEKELQMWKQLSALHDEVEVHLELVQEAGEDTVTAEALEALEGYASALDDAEVIHLLSDTDDARDAILTIHPGAGGTESQDWAEMLQRMYFRWIERRGYEYQVLDFQPGEEAGIKDVTVEVKGERAYGYLKAEAGVHRLVRISPFDASSRRHTSFASVFVYPAGAEDLDIAIIDKDARMRRHHGCAGQASRV
ncbi:MAG: PCRF domain-containing protein, partial [Candidatus Neomarinimicrobiota bacterium]